MQGICERHVLRVAESPKTTHPQWKIQYLIICVAMLRYNVAQTKLTVRKVTS